MAKTLDVATVPVDGVISFPAKIKDKIGIKKGDRFIVFKINHELILKKIELPTIKRFENLSQWGRRFAKQKNIKPKDIIRDD